MSDADSTWRVLVRGVRKRCPRCGVGRVFQRWYSALEHCSACGLSFCERDGAGDTWAFMYLSTAGLTGCIVVVMLLVRPESLWQGRLYVLATAILLIVGTLPRRRSLGIAVNHLIARRLSRLERTDENRS